MNFHCIPYWCKEEEGCAVCAHQSLRTADGQCAECHPGYIKTLDNLCEPYTCLTGACDLGVTLFPKREQTPLPGEGSACKTCRPQSERTGHGHLDPISGAVSMAPPFRVCPPILSKAASKGQMHHTHVFMCIYIYR